MYGDSFVGIAFIMKTLSSPLSVIAALCAATSFCSSSILASTISATQVGGFFADGSTDNSVSFQNYYVGYSTLSSLAERRNFFYFDLTSVTDPIVAAELTLTMPDGGLIFGGGDVTEEFVISGSGDAGYIAAILDPMIDPMSATALFDSFGVHLGPTAAPLGEIGSFTFDSSVPIPLPLEVVIPLGAEGLDLINANLGGEVVITGRIADFTPGVPGPEMSEILFGLSDVVDMAGMPTALAVPSLTVTSVPEPSSTTFAVLASTGLFLRRKRG